MTAAVAVIPITVLASACSSGSAGSAAGGTAHDAGSTAAPITIGFIGSLQSAAYNFPETAAAAQAEVDAVNTAGGIKGSKVKLVTCNDQTDPNQAAACVRQMTDAGAVGVIGGISTEGQVITADLQSAGLVYTGERALSPGELNSPISFPMVGGSESSAAGLALYAAKTADCKRPFQVISDDSPAQLTAAAFGNAFKSASGISVGQVVTPSPNTSYAAAAASAASSHADCVFFALDVAEMPKAVPAFRSVLPSAKYFSTAGSFPAPIITALGKAANGIYLSDSVLPVTTTGNATLNQFKAEMAKYEPKSVVDGFAVTSWLGTRLLLNTIAGMSGSVTAQTVLKAFDGLGTVDSGGLIGNFSFAKPSTVANAKREFNSTYTVFQIEGNSFKLSAPGFADAASAMN